MIDWRNSVEAWGSVQKTLHWAIALAVVALAVLGWVMTGLPPGRRAFELYALHKSIGLTLLALVVARIAWRLSQPRPVWPAAMRAWERRTAVAVHVGLYATLVAMATSGWVLHSASGLPLRWFGLARVPSIAPRGDALKLLAADVHYALFWLLALLVAAHVAGALKHHYVDRDDVLRSMLPRWRASPREAPAHDPAPGSEEPK